MRIEMIDARAAERPAAPVVREAGPGDVAELSEVLQAAFHPFATVLPPIVFARYLADLLDLSQHGRHGQLLVAEIDGRIRGSAAFYPNTHGQGTGWPPGWAGGRGMAVHPGARGQGIARALLAECERRARAHGARVFAFHTATFTTDAIALYERLGYCRAPHFDVDLTAHYGLATPTPIMAIAYRRNLREAGPCAGGSRTGHRLPPIARSRRRPSVTISAAATGTRLLGAGAATS